MTSEAITDDDLRDVIDTLTARVAELEGENKKWAAMKSEGRIKERIRLLIAENARLREALQVAYDDGTLAKYARDLVSAALQEQRKGTEHDAE
jgi:bacterioferritin-associated ferredoxin